MKFLLQGKRNLWQFMDAAGLEKHTWFTSILMPGPVSFLRLPV